MYLIKYIDHHFFIFNKIFFYNFKFYLNWFQPNKSNILGMINRSVRFENDRIELPNKIRSVQFGYRKVKILINILDLIIVLILNEI